MTNDEIRAKVERFDTVVSQYAEDVKTFQTETEGSMRELDAAMSRLSEAWSSELFNAFSDRMAERQANIRDCLNRAQRLETYLKQKSEEMGQILDRLKAASSDL